MNRAIIRHLAETLAYLNSRNTPRRPMFLETLADGTLREHGGTRTFADLDAYRAAYGLNKTQGPMLIFSYIGEDAPTPA